MITTHTTERPVDALGIEHRYGCEMPGWISDKPARRGWHMIRCAGCGTVRLVRASGTAK